MTTLRILALSALAVLAVGACSAAAAPSPVLTPSPEPSASAPADGAGTAPGNPGETPDPNAPVGTEVPPGSGDPGAFDPSSGRIVTPKPGQLDVHPVRAMTLKASVSGRHVVVTIAYTSGVEPCNTLDSIVVVTAAHSFELTLREGHGPEKVACIEIAEFRRAIVDLGELAPGTYRIADGTGGADPISVTVA
jgi:hypothetical protein